MAESLHLTREGMERLSQEVKVIRARLRIMDNIILDEMEKRRKDERDNDTLDQGATDS